MNLRVSMASTASPALDSNNSLALGEKIERHGVLHTPLETLVDILLPDDLVEVGLGLRVVEGVDAAVEVGVAGGGGGAGDHDDGTAGAVLGDEAGGVTTTANISRNSTGEGEGGHTRY